MILSGTTVRPEQVRLLARMFEGEALGEKLERAITNSNSLVALSLDDRHRIVAVLGEETPAGLAELRVVLIRQLKQRSDREAQSRRIRLNQDRVQRRRDRPGFG